MNALGKLLRDPVLIVIVAAAALYATVANQYYLFLLTLGALTVIVGVGLNVLIGLTGQVSFGHVGFYALGAYATAILAAKYGWARIRHPIYGLRLATSQRRKWPCIFKVAENG